MITFKLSESMENTRWFGDILDEIGVDYSVEKFEHFRERKAELSIFIEPEAVFNAINCSMLPVQRVLVKGRKDFRLQLCFDSFTVKAFFDDSATFATTHRIVTNRIEMKRTLMINP